DLIRWGFYGCLAGILINPYFPMNLGWCLRMIGIAFQSWNLPASEKSTESLPITTLDFLKKFGPICFFSWAGTLLALQANLEKTTKKLNPLLLPVGLMASSL